MIQIIKRSGLGFSPKLYASLRNGARYPVLVAEKVATIQELWMIHGVKEGKKVRRTHLLRRFGLEARRPKHTNFVEISRAYSRTGLD